MTDGRRAAAALVEHYRTMRAELLAAVEGLSEAKATEPTIDGWSVKDHLAHIAFWDNVRAEEVLRMTAGYDSTWKLAPELEAAISPVVYAMHRDISLEQARWELDGSHRRLLAALAGANDRALESSRYGEAGLQSRHEAAHTGWIRRWRSDRAF